MLTFITLNSASVMQKMIPSAFEAGLTASANDTENKRHAVIGGVGVVPPVRRHHHRQRLTHQCNGDGVAARHDVTQRDAVKSEGQDRKGDADSNEGRPVHTPKLEGPARAQIEL